MTFAKAKEAFTDNKRHLTAADGHLWNTNLGLLNLAQALEKAHRDLERRVRALEQLQQQQERGLRQMQADARRR